MRLLGTASDERLLAMLEALADHDAAAALRLLDQSAGEGVQPAELLGGLLDFLRDAMVLAVGADSILLAVTPRQRPQFEAHRRALDDRLDPGRAADPRRVPGRMRGSLHGRLLVETGPGSRRPAGRPARRWARWSSGSRALESGAPPARTARAGGARKPSQPGDARPRPPAVRPPPPASRPRSPHDAQPAAEASAAPTVAAGRVPPAPRRADHRAAADRRPSTTCSRSSTRARRRHRRSWSRARRRGRSRTAPRRRSPSRSAPAPCNDASLRWISTRSGRSGPTCQEGRCEAGLAARARSSRSRVDRPGRPGHRRQAGIQFGGRRVRNARGLAKIEQALQRLIHRPVTVNYERSAEAEGVAADGRPRRAAADALAADPLVQKVSSCSRPGRSTGIRRRPIVDLSSASRGLWPDRELARLLIERPRVRSGTRTPSEKGSRVQSTGNARGPDGERRQAARVVRKAFESLGQLEVEGTAGGGAVTAKVNGRLEVVSVRIDPKLLADGDAELLEDLVAAAVNAGAGQGPRGGGQVARLDDRRSAARPVPRLGAPRGPGRRGTLTMAGSGYAAAVDRLITALGRLPGIGAKSAERLAHHLLNARPKRPSSWPRPSAPPKSRSATARSASTSPRPTSPSARSAATPAAIRRSSASSSNRAT